jgi:hypothetical protein
MSKIEVNTVDVQCGSTLTLGSSGKTVSLASGAAQTGFGRTGTVNWCTTAKTSPLTVASGNGYFVNTSGGAITVTLPSSPSAGDIVAFKDYANTWDSNNVTVGRGGSKINGECRDATLSTESQSVTLIYVDGTKGWQDIHDSTANVTGAPAYVVATGGTILTCGDHKTHIFTADSTFTVTNGGAACGSNTVDYFVIAGGAGGNTWGGGGGGAGGFRLSNSLSVPAPTMSPLINPSGLPVPTAAYPITVGAGGSKAPAYVGGAGGPGATNGAVSTFSTITSTGGGHGGFDCESAEPGGSGGGGPRCTGKSIGNGNTPPVSPPQGNNGGTGGTGPAGYFGGGGGGAGAVGNSFTGPNDGGPGGVGSFIADTVFGPTAPSYGSPGPVSSTRYFSGGGSGANVATGASTGGSGGGGSTSPGGATDGTANTGGGGGAAYAPTPSSNTAGASGAGGSGFVAIRYKFQN